MGNDLYIIGAGGFGREVAWLIRRINKSEPTWNIVGFIDDDPDKIGTIEDGYLVVGGIEYLERLGEDFYVVCAVGSSHVRQKIIEKVNRIPGIQFATLIDPDAIISDRVSIGKGAIICAGTIVTVDTVIGNHVIINLQCTVGHDAVIDDFVTLYPSVNISGMVRIAECVELGTGMQIIQGKTIAAYIIVGAGAVVVNDLVEKGTYVGVPAKKISD